MTFGLGNTVKYAFLGENPDSYLLMVSQQKERRLSPLGYNVILSVTSRSSDRNREIADQFEEETGMDLSLRVPESLQSQMDLISRLFFKF